MLTIKQDSINQITVTLYEKKRYDTNVYLIELINAADEKFYTLALDKSITTRYNLFCLTEVSGSTYNPLNAEIKLVLKGQYTYNIYESPDSSLDPTGLNLCETGRLLVLGDRTEVTTYSNPKTTTFYQKD